MESMLLAWQNDDDDETKEGIACIQVNNQFSTFEHT